MRITFELDDGTEALLRLSAARMQLSTGRPQDPSEIAKALVREVLIDDAAEHGLTPDAARVQ